MVIFLNKVYLYEYYLSEGLTQKKMLPYQARIRARRFEEFGEWVRHDGEEFLYVFNKIDVPKIKIPHRNKTEHKPYWEYYNDETKEIVTKRFKEDIEFFGYKFGE